MSGVGLPQNGLPIEDDDIEFFDQKGLVRIMSRGRSLIRFRVTPEGENYYATMKTRSKQDRGVVKVRSDAYKQDGVLVATFRRAVLVPRQSVGTPEEAA
ncbi:MAG: hypothetical protein WKF33_00225 [Thermoleophilaceae bacterium]